MESLISVSAVYFSYYNPHAQITFLNAQNRPELSLVYDFSPHSWNCCLFLVFSNRHRPSFSALASEQFVYPPQLDRFVVQPQCSSNINICNNDNISKAVCIQPCNTVRNERDFLKHPHDFQSLTVVTIPRQPAITVFTGTTDQTTISAS